MTPHDSPRQAEDGPERPGPEPTRPAPPGPGDPRGPLGPGDQLASLSERLRRAQEAADRLVREATAAAQRTVAEEPAGTGPGDTGRPPPRGYAVPDDAEGRSSIAD